jgi:ABC-type transport system substrate-binding protein
MRAPWPCGTWKVILTASLVVAACTSPLPIAATTEVDPDGEITTGMRRLADRIDPQSYAQDQRRHSAMVFEGLMTFDPSALTPVPAAARDQPRISDDGLTYTFTLREGLKYSDGSPLTARDFVYAFSRLCEPGAGSPAFVVRLVVGCQTLKRTDPKTTSSEALQAARAAVGLRANGENALVVNLTEPASYFTSLTAMPLGHPIRESDVTRAGASYGREISTFIGNGPFKLVEWVPGERLVFARNEHYRTPAKLKRWTKVVIGDELTFAAYLNNEIDLFGGLPSERAASVSAYRDKIDADAGLRAQLVTGPGAFTDMYMLNPSRAPFTDRKVRQAFAKAIDRAEFVHEGAALSFIPPGRPGHDPDDTFQRSDPVRARELLGSSTFAGRPELLTIAITYPSFDPQGRTLAEFPQQQIKRNLGIDVRIEAVDGLTLDQMYATPRTAPQMIFIRWGRNEPPDRQFWLAAFQANGPLGRSVGYTNAEFDTLVREADREADPARRADLQRHAERVLSEDAVAIWFWWGPNAYLRKPWVKGVTDSGVDIEYGLLRLAEIHVVKKKSS